METLLKLFTALFIIFIGFWFGHIFSKDQKKHKEEVKKIRNERIAKWQEEYLYKGENL
jgi:hypothetical protein